MQNKPTSYPALRNLIVGLLLVVGLVTALAINPGTSAVVFAVDGDHPGDPAEAAGEIETLPDDAELLGVWTVDGVSYAVNVDTRLGPDLTVYAVGECVEVKYDAETDPFTAHKIEHDADCDGEGDDDGDGDHHGDSDEAAGEIESLPDNADLLGVWTVDDVNYAVNVDTRLGPDLTVYAVGECVEVKYDAETDPFTARKIEHDADCDGEGDDDGDGDHHGDSDEAAGEIESLPDNADLLGVWTVDDVNYAVNVDTRLGPDLTVYAVGECVEVKYDAETDPFTAHKIEHDADCDGEGDGSGDGDHDGDGPEFKGRVEVLPGTENQIGIWVVRGMEFNVTDATEQETEYGPFEVGVCVEIDYDDSTTPYTAIKIEGEREHACRGGGGGDDNHDGEGELYGSLQAFPSGLIGEWQVGGWTFMADEETEFDQEHGDFEVGALVKVEFYVTNDGINHATEIKVKDDHDDDHRHGADGHAYGPIGSFPANLVGEWVIGDLRYTANGETRFEQEDGDFAVDVWVKVGYYVDEDDNRIAVKIETEEGHGGGQEPDLSKFVGFVESMPAPGFVGDWGVGGEIFVAGSQARFEEEHGAFAVGAYVELEYRLVDGVNKLHEMQTEVPPDAGDANALGQIESMDDAAAADLNAASIWRIGGQDYTVTDATQLNDDQAALAVGATAFVNSYTDTDGSQVATSVTGVEIAHKVFLPLTVTQ